MMHLYYSPIKWTLSELCGSLSVNAFYELLTDAFDVECYSIGTDDVTSMDYEVEREGLKQMQSSLISGDISEKQDEIYRRQLEIMGCTHDEFLKVLNSILSIKTDWIRISWF